MKILILVTSLLVYAGLHSCYSIGPPCEAKTNETVVLLHGLARSGKAMNRMEKVLTAAGYQVINHDYPSTSSDLETLTADIFQALEPQINTAAKLHFVTHSMGGIILRQHLEEHDLPNLGRVVMLAPPSRGSEVPDKLGHLAVFRWINGPAGNQLGTGTNSRPLRLKDPEFELGIIAGDRSINPILSMLIPGLDDGKVALARVKPAQFSDYMQLHTTHATMMWNRTVLKQTLHFLAAGCFEHHTTNALFSPKINNTLYAMQGTHPLTLGGRP